VAFDEEVEVLKTCACPDCVLTFVVSKTARKVYYNAHHQQKAKDYRKKLRASSIVLKKGAS